MGLLDEIKKHGSETYNTLSEGLMGDRARGLLDMFAGNIKSGLPMLDKDPMDWEAADVLNVAMGGTIAGRMAKTANPEMLKRADDMKAAGYSRDEIWKTTGEEFNQPAFFDGDNNLKWEIDDSAYKYTPENLDKISFDDITVRDGTVARSTDHPAMLDAYPDLRDVQAIDYPFRSKRGTSGQYAPKDTKREYPASVTMWDSGINTKRSTNIHELNHGIQDIENLPLGGSPSQFNNKNRDVLNLQRKQQSERLKDSGFDTWAEDLMLNNSERYNSLLTEGNSDNGWMGPMYKAFELESKNNKGFSGIATQADRAISKSLKETTFTPYESYQRLAGEADARAVQARMDMTMPERIDRPFPKDYDVPESEFIYNYKKGLLE